MKSSIAFGTVYAPHFGPPGKKNKSKELERIRQGSMCEFANVLRFA
jgi:hypothetical protein